MTKGSAWRWGAPRLITRPQLLAYLAIEEPELRLRMKQGRVPGPMWGTAPDQATARWDRHAVDRALDRAAGLQCSVEADVAELDAAFKCAPGAAPAGRSRRPRTW